MKATQKKLSKHILSDKIAEALTVKPRADIEDDHIFHTKPQTVSRADFDLPESVVGNEPAISDFRKRNTNLLSEISKKYEGKVVSRKELEKQSDDDKDNLSDESDAENDNISMLNSSGELETKSKDNYDSDEEIIREIKNKNKISQDTEDSDTGVDDSESDDYGIYNYLKTNDSNDSDKNDDEDMEDNEEGHISQIDEPVKEKFEHIKKQNLSEEARKGTCVRNQLMLWEGLLEMRIHLQKCMNSANQMPIPDTYKELKKNNEFTEQSLFTQSNVAKVLDKMLTLQNMLLNKFPETKSISNKQTTAKQNQKENIDSDEEIPSDTDCEEIPSDTEPEDNVEEKQKSIKSKKQKSISGKKRKLQDYEKEISSSHKAFKAFKDTTIQKWNDKTRLATASNIKNTATNSIIQQIDYILSDRNKLIRRTQLKRSEYSIIGHKKPILSNDNKDENRAEMQAVTNDRKQNDEYIPEIFDDSDFYHQLLRELIECKSADISDPVQLSRQWIALQQMRSKMKRKVDTKATKGRRIKYVVHNPLVNYMAADRQSTWTDERCKELYSSLFGKMFEHNNMGINTDVQSDVNNK